MAEPVQIDLPPGVVNTASRKRKSANWREVNLIRWERTTMKPVGGWSKYTFGPFASRPRAIHKWIDNGGTTHIAYLCEQHCYVYTDGVFTDISPTPAITPPVTGDYAIGGYGDGDYSDGTYGTARAAYPRAASFTPCYSIDNWGEDLLVMTSADGRLLKWTPGDAALTIVAGAPENNRSFTVTPDRFVIIFGIDGQSWEFGWCDQENINDWNFASTTNKAGSLPVEPRAPLVAHIKTGGGVLAFTNRAAALISFVGLPYIYSYDRISDASVPYSAASIAEIPDGVIWPSVNGFWLYNGTNIAAVDCPVWDWILERINPVASKYASCMVNISAKSEVWWFFATGGDTDQNDHYVVYNYRSQIWYMGQLSRTAGLSYPNDINPVMTDDQYAYSHEDGFDYAGAPELPWAETFTMNIANGYNRMTIHQMLPEIQDNSDAVQFIFIKQENPSKPDGEIESVPKLVKSNGYVDVRETARDFRMRIEGILTDNWGMDNVNIDVRGRGQK